MMMRRTPSIRRFLLKAMTAGLLLSAVTSGLFFWSSSKTEMYEVYEANLVQVAKAIAAHQTALVASGPMTPAGQRIQPSKITREEDFFVRVTHGQSDLSYVSHPDMQLPRTIDPGFHNVFHEGQKWRVFVLRSDGNTVEVAQSLALRQQAVNEVIRGLLLPQLSFIPLIGALIWLIVGISLRPLAVISKTLESRSRDLLQPLSTKEIPVEILPLIEALNSLLERVEQLISVLRRFTSDAAHELRTPLTALKLQLTLLTRAQDDEQRQEAMTQLDTGIDRAAALVQQLLTLARVEPDAAEIPMHVIDLTVVIKYVVQELLSAATSKKIDMGVGFTETDVPFDPNVRGNADMLRIMFGNIINNAIIYTPENGHVDITFSRDAASIIVRVKDSGPGIPPHEMGKVFSRFYRGQGVTQKGSGLGLAIASEIAHRHGASINIENVDAANGGLQVDVVFPLKAI